MESRPKQWRRIVIGTNIDMTAPCSGLALEQPAVARSVATDAPQSGRILVVGTDRDANGRSPAGTGAKVAAIAVYDSLMKPAELYGEAKTIMNSDLSPALYSSTHLTRSTQSFAHGIDPDLHRAAADLFETLWRDQ